MKKNLQRLLSLLLVLMLLFTLAPAVFAGRDDGDVPDGADLDPEDSGEWDSDRPTGLIVPDVCVYFSFFDLPMKAGDSTSVTASVSGADEGATYDWYCSDESVVSIRGRKNAVTVTALKPGEAEIMLCVTRGDELSSDFDYFDVKVTGASTPVVLSGGGSVTLEEGETALLNAGVSGGSGSYTYEWDAYGDAALSFVDRMRGNAEVHAGHSGTGSVILTAYDAEDSSNNDTVIWEFNVTKKKQAEPPTVEMNRGSVDLGTGASGTLMLSVTGGSGNYEYLWSSDNSAVVSVRGKGDSAEIRAADTLLPGSNTAEISAYVRDKDSGLTSNTVRCTVTVSGGSTSFNCSDAAEGGSCYDMGILASQISAAFRQNFGSDISYSATVRFENVGSGAGSIRLSDGTAIRAGTSYTFNTFLSMVFNAGASGTFSTGYMIVDGGNTIDGTISLYVTGGVAVKDASLSPSTMQLSTNSNQYLTLTVTPANAAYTVDWTVEDSRFVNVAGSGNKVTVTSANRTGSTKVTAIITDSAGKRLTRTCTVSVSEPAPFDPNIYYDPSITIMLGSDYYGSKLADGMASRFKSAFNINLADGASILFPSLGSSVYGTLRTRDGSAAVTNRNYTFRDWIDMYFVPSAAGTYNMTYQLSYQNHLLLGTIRIVIESSSLNVTMTPNSLQMAPYSSQYVYLDISPSSALYRVSWASSDTKVATVSGSNSSAVVNSVGAGTATVYAIVTDSRGIEVRRGCTVVVSSSGGTTFNPSVSTTLGIPYVGTGTSSAMRSQFQAVFGLALGDNAIIRFASTGNNEVGVMRLSDGSMIRPNTDYTLAQYVAMYTQPVSAGTYAVPYTLTYAGKTMSGTVSVLISAASISTNLSLPSRSPYWFSDALNGSTGGAVFADSVRNTVGSEWGFLRFDRSSDGGNGTLYLDRSYGALTPSVNVTPAMLAQLFYVPGELTGTFTAPYTVYTGSGTVIGTGTLSISAQSAGFSDVPEYAYYAPAVSWAVGRGITSGTGGSLFSPDMIVTRGQAVTFLWRAAGQPANAVTTNPFTDVVPGAYYYDAVLWAVQQGITNGTSETTFSPDLPLQRNQLLTFLCRANGGYAGGPDWSSLAVGWANARGLLTGIPGDFIAESECPRSDVVYYLWKNYNS